MPQPPRCLVPDVDHDPIQLDAGARHHLGRVLRMRPGDALQLVDGRGGLADARWAGTAPAIERRHPRRAPPADGVTLAVAVPRLPRLDWLVEKAAELDVAALRLLETEHGQRAVSAGRIERLARKADEALLQCRRLHRLAIHAPAPLAAVLDDHRSHELWLAAPGADEGAAPGAEASGRRGGPLLVLVGPEGGFSQDEIEWAQAAGARRATLGHTVLRVETAALALAARAAEWSLRP